LYAISRRDIPLAQQAIQAGHAAVEYAFSYGRPPDHHPSYVHLTIRDKEDLLCLQTMLHSEGFDTSEFHEPYKAWGLTAISCLLTEEHRPLLSHLKLWKPGAPA
jgi:hypothetical protein